MYYIDHINFCDVFSQFSAGLASLDGFIYAVGGWESQYRLDSVERYDPSTNSWEFVQKLKIAVTSAAVIGHDKMLYVAGMMI